MSLFQGESISGFLLIVAVQQQLREKSSRRHVLHSAGEGDTAAGQHVAERGLRLLIVSSCVSLSYALQQHQGLLQGAGLQALMDDVAALLPDTLRVGFTRAFASIV